jgi:hypothetical protein
MDALHRAGDARTDVDALDGLGAAGDGVAPTGATRSVNAVATKAATAVSAVPATQRRRRAGCVTWFIVDS